MLCHGLDFDDTHSDSIAHVSVVTCPASLAVAEAGGAAGRDALAAIVAANEVVTRIGMAASGRFHARGFHPTAVCGIFGATTAAARLGGLDSGRAASALGIAGSLASGVFAYLEDGTATKPIHPAWAAHGGLVAARLAAHGAEGPPSIFEGKFGLYHAFLGAGKDEIDLDAQLADLGSRWETPRIAFKPYPACHFMHGAVGATAEAGAGGLLPDDVEEIVVTVPAAGVDLVLEPADKKVAPRTTYEAKFSLQYSAAAMVVHGRCGVTTYADDAIRDPRVLELAQRVRYETKDYPTYPAAFPGRRSHHDAGRAHARGRPAAPARRAREPDDGRRGAGEVPRERRAGARAAKPWRRSRQAVLTLEEQDDLRAALAPLAAAALEPTPA